MRRAGTSLLPFSSSTSNATAPLVPSSSFVMASSKKKTATQARPSKAPAAGEPKQALLRSSIIDEKGMAKARPLLDGEHHEEGIV